MKRNVDSASYGEGRASMGRAAIAGDDGGERLCDQMSRLQRLMRIVQD
jgi:hypothetical protein